MRNGSIKDLPHPINSELRSRSRRGILISSGIVLANPFLAQHRSAHASGAGIAIAVIAMVSAISSFFRSSGDAELQLRSVHVKLDAVLTSVDALSKMIVQLAEAVAKLGVAIGQTPDITNSKALVNKIVAVEQNVKDYLAKSYAVTDAEKSALVQRELVNLSTLVSELRTGVNTFGAEPTLCLGAYSAVATIEVVRRGLKRLQRLSDGDRAMAKTVLANASGVMRAMESEAIAGLQTLPIRRQEWATNCLQAAAKIKKEHPELTKLLLREDFEVPGKTKDEIVKLEQCFKGEANRTYSLDEDLFTYGDPGARAGARSTRKSGHHSVYRESTKSVKWAFNKQTANAIGGRTVYVIAATRGPEQNHGIDRDVITATSRELQTHDLITNFGDQSASACLKYSAIDANDSNAIGSFLALLDIYNQAAAYEAYLNLLTANSKQHLNQASLYMKRL